MYKQKWKNYYFPAKPIILSPKWIRIRSIGRDVLSSKAQLKLEWIIFYYTYGKNNATVTATHFGITRKTLHKWLKCFDEKNLKSLEERSKRPDNTRTWMVTRVEEERIILLRKENMELGKCKIKRIYERENGVTISTWKIERVIRRYNLFPEKDKHTYQVEKRGKQAHKIRIHTVREQIKQINEFGFLWHIDAVIIWWYGQRRILFTAIEDITKIAFARCYTTNSSQYAKDFLERLMYLTEGKITVMHQDNGSEFKGEFEKACKRLNIFQIYSRPYTPKDNPALERFNNTIQYEWLKYSKVGLEDIREANKDLTTWLIKYNNYRPHQSLDYKTPLEYAYEQFFKVSPMWPARTHYCFFKTV